jgi:hypothetical protein
MFESRRDSATTLPDVGKVRLLGELCREELGAAQTYEKALSLATLRKHSDVLGRCFASHSNRASELARQISLLGGEPPTAPGVWSSLVPALTTAALVVSERLALALLEEAEEHGMKSYYDHVSELDPASQLLVVERILPAQERTHAAIAELKRGVAS